MSLDIGRAYLADVLSQFEELKGQAERALEQVDETAFFAPLDTEANSLALLVKHLAGNNRSRWRDFLTTDGEKPDRRRDREFEREPGDTRESLMTAWAEGWAVLFGTLRALTPDDLGRTVTIRHEPVAVLQAINRALAHQAAHVGQIVLLAKHARGSAWRTLSVRRGQSERLNAAMARRQGRSDAL
jgi:hypothetical protein